MKKSMPQVREFMTYTPFKIDAKITVQKAAERMQDIKIRHLPVEHFGKLVGVLSERSVKAALTSSLSDKLNVEDIMARDPYVVDATTCLQSTPSDSGNVLHLMDL